MRARLLLPFLVAALAGCQAQNHASVFIAALCAAPNDASQCTYATECAAQTIGQSAIDVNGGGAFYFAAVQVNNQALNNKNAGQGRVNTRDAWIESYEVEYLNLPYGKFNKEVLGSAFVPAEGSAVIGIKPIPEAILAQLRALVAGTERDVVITIRLYGRWGDGSHFTTGDFQMPIKICDGTGCVPTALFSATPCPTAGDVRIVCPEAGQVPGVASCVAP